MKLLHFACYTALAACTTLPSAPEAKAMIYVMLACMALVNDET